MEIQEVWRRIFRLKNGKVLRPEMSVSLFSRKDGEKKRQVCIVGIEQIELAEVLRVVAGNGGEVRIELVVGLDEEIAVRVGEYTGELADDLVSLALCSRIHNDGEREVPKRLPVTQDTEAIAKVLDVGLFRFVYQYVARIGLCGVTGRL